MISVLFAATLLGLLSYFDLMAVDVGEGSAALLLRSAVAQKRCWTQANSTKYSRHREATHIEKQQQARSATETGRTSGVAVSNLATSRRAMISNDGKLSILEPTSKEK